jgi:tetratricopeptide (TPR) repeat protein
MTSNPAATVYQLAMKAGERALITGANSEAVEAYSKAREADPSSSEALFNLGISLHRDQKLAEAVSAWQNCLELDKQAGRERSDVLTNLAAGLAVLSSQQGQGSEAAKQSTTQAFEYIKRARQLEP